MEKQGRRNWPEKHKEEGKQHRNLPKKYRGDRRTTKENKGGRNKEKIRNRERIRRKEESKRKGKN